VVVGIIFNVYNVTVSYWNPSSHCLPLSYAESSTSLA